MRLKIASTQQKALVCLLLSPQSPSPGVQSLRRTFIPAWGPSKQSLWDALPDAAQRPVRSCRFAAGV